MIIPTLGGDRAQWRENLFMQKRHQASGAGEFLTLHKNAVVELGSKIGV